MAKLQKEITRKYNLDLTEEEFYAFLVLVGGVSYTEFKDLCNSRYSVRVGRASPEDFKIIDPDNWKKLYDELDNNK